MSKRWSVWLGVVSALAGAGFVGYRSGHPGAARGTEPPPAHRAAKAEAVSDSAAVRALEAEVNQLESQLGALTEAVSHRPKAGSTEPEPVAPEPTRADLEASVVEWQAHMSEVHESFGAEPRSAAWAEATRTALQEALDSDTVLASLVRNVECRSTTCRVEFADHAEPGFSASMSAFLSRVGHLLPRMEADITDNPDGTKSASIYLFSDTTTSDG